MRKTHYISLILIVAVLTTYTYTMRYRTLEHPAPRDLSLVPRSAGGYTGTDGQLESASLGVLGADATLFRTYRREGSPPVWLFLGYFSTQQERSQIHSPKHCYPGSGWNIVHEGSVDIGSPPGSLRAKQLVISDGLGKRIVVYWFSTPTGILRDEFALKWYQTKRSLLGKPQVSTFVRFSTPVPDGRDESVVENHLLDFIESIADTVDSVLNGPAMKGSDNGTTGG